MSKESPPNMSMAATPEQAEALLAACSALRGRHSRGDWRKHVSTHPLGVGPLLHRHFGGWSDLSEVHPEIGQRFIELPHTSEAVAVDHAFNLSFTYGVLSKRLKTYGTSSLVEGGFTRYRMLQNSNGTYQISADAEFTLDENGGFTWSPPSQRLSGRYDLQRGLAFSNGTDQPLHEVIKVLHTEYLETKANFARGIMELPTPTVENGEGYSGGVPHGLIQESGMYAVTAPEADIIIGAVRNAHFA